MVAWRRCSAPPGSIVPDNVMTGTRPGQRGHGSAGRAGGSEVRPWCSRDIACLDPTWSDAATSRWHRSTDSESLSPSRGRSTLLAGGRREQRSGYIGCRRHALDIARVRMREDAAYPIVGGSPTAASDSSLTLGRSAYSQLAMRLSAVLQIPGCGASLWRSLRVHTLRAIFVLKWCSFGPSCCQVAVVKVLKRGGTFRRRRRRCASWLQVPGPRCGDVCSEHDRRSSDFTGRVRNERRHYLAASARRGNLRRTRPGQKH